MVDFTLDAYRIYLSAIKRSGLRFLRFDELIGNQDAFSSFCLVRHDVDRKPENALKMAELENKMGVVSTYYFRYKKHTFIPEIIKQIHSLGHEIGYHYECLSDRNGDFEKALDDFDKNLEAFRKTVPVKTISMHGRPFKRFDNRDLWRDKKRHALLNEKFKITGEVYLDINYEDIAYINDTGRNWTADAANARDKVRSNVNANFASSEGLLDFLSSSPHRKMIFQVHPERWSNKRVEWVKQLIQDKGINFAKSVISLLRSANK